ncbi:hypothetical protein BJ170DRAFT_96027 [Xylariales sp. AK1849]|nr:hypothetical protein BJ170DRAFT_96027 [Xylariales sp. AK1849]
MMESLSIRRLRTISHLPFRYSRIRIVGNSCGLGSECSEVHGHPICDPRAIPATSSLLARPAATLFAAESSASRICHCTDFPYLLRFSICQAMSAERATTSRRTREPTPSEGHRGTLESCEDCVAEPAAVETLETDGWDGRGSGGCLPTTCLGCTRMTISGDGGAFEPRAAVAWSICIGDLVTRTYDATKTLGLWGSVALRYR